MPPVSERPVEDASESVTVAEADASLAAAYAVHTPEDNRRLYAQWAPTYESGFIVPKGYVYHRNVAAVFRDVLESAGLLDGMLSDTPDETHNRPILDIGCGTGIVGVELAAMGFRQLEGIDISPEMINEARATLWPPAGGTDLPADATLGGTPEPTPVYQRLIRADLTQGVPLPDDQFGSMLSAGAFTHGHLDPPVINELCRLAAPGARCALGINAAHFADRRFDAWFNAAVEKEIIADLGYVYVPIYETSDPDDPDQMAHVATFTVLAN